MPISTWEDINMSFWFWSTILHVCFCANTLPFQLLELCSIFWDHGKQYLQLYSFPQKCLEYLEPFLVPYKFENYSIQSWEKYYHLHVERDFTESVNWLGKYSHFINLNLSITSHNFFLSVNFFNVIIFFIILKFCYYMFFLPLCMH